MERNEAREHFKNLGLSYDVLTKEDIMVLQNMLGLISCMAVYMPDRWT
ncbi:hypothetical protein FB479_101774 [Brevibacillus sp. AG162]|nr:hypothetical protein [Brevibacillus sp. AG162]TQK75162.1 hypothetical protein FB479_101774 [Brevibacillus sp. AG162]